MLGQVIPLSGVRYPRDSHPSTCPLTSPCFPLSFPLSLPFPPLSSPFLSPSLPYHPLPDSSSLTLPPPPLLPHSPPSLSLLTSSLIRHDNFNHPLLNLPLNSLCFLLPSMEGSWYVQVYAGNAGDCRVLYTLFVLLA